MQIFETPSFWFMSIKVNKAGYYRLHDTSEKSAAQSFLRTNTYSIVLG